MDNNRFTFALSAHNKIIVERYWRIPNNNQDSILDIESVVNLIDNYINEKYINNETIYTIVVSFKYLNEDIKRYIDIKDRSKRELYRIDIRPILELIRRSLKLDKFTNKPQSDVNELVFSCKK
jgi:hypothetical protein